MAQPPIQAKHLFGRMSQYLLSLRELVPEDVFLEVSTAGDQLDSAAHLISEKIFVPTPMDVRQARDEEAEEAAESSFKLVHSNEVHIDDWLYGRGATQLLGNRELAYAHFVLAHFRKPAAMRAAQAFLFEDKPLYCDYEGQTLRVTGASRMGYICLQSDLDKDHGYDKTAWMSIGPNPALTNWRATP